MLPKVIVSIAQIAVGIIVGTKASEALDKGVEVVKKKVVEAKEKGAQQ